MTTDRTVLVTGSTGIAAATAERLARDGAAVFVTSRTEANCRALAERIQGMGGRAAWLAAELTDEAAVDAAVDAAGSSFGRIDACFSAAGGSGRRFGDGPIHELTTEGWDRTLELNLRSQALVARAVVRRMLDQDPDAGGSRGAIVLLSSVLALEPVPVLFETHAYAAAKGAIAALARSMAAAYAPSGIRVNVVAPGLVDTPMSARAAADRDTVDFARRKQPLARGFLAADDVAAAVVFLLGDGARGITGQILAVDGGWSVTSAGTDPAPDRQAHGLSETPP